ncbi:hypothetical protein ACWDO7_09565 [Streptomyces sp. NPDC003656]
MGSLRNPIGPLPSSIYWRRRVVLVSVVAVLALLVTWIVTSGGGGGKKNADGSNGKNPAHTITPGPSSSGPAISQHPGGRDESSGGDGSGGDEGSGSGSGGGSGADDGDGSGDGSGTGGSGSGSGSGSVGTGSGSGGGAGTAETIPASSSLPDCAPGAVTLSLRSVHNSYSPDQTPTFELVVKNTGSAACKTDLGPQHTILTITPADGDDPFWSSDDCPKNAAARFYKVPAGQSITYTLKWDRAQSTDKCETPQPNKAKPGTYLLEAKTPGFKKTQTSFVLSAD